MSLLESFTYLIGIFDKMTSEQVEIYKKNECSNMMIGVKIIMDRFLSNYASKQEDILSEPTELKDLLIILERILVHGFKSKLSIYEGISFDDVLTFIKNISEYSIDIKEVYLQTIKLENLTENVTRVRAFLRLLMMTNKTDLFFKIIEDHDISLFYEPLAFLRSQNLPIISDILMVLRGFVINFYLDQDELSYLSLNINLSNYIKPIVIVESQSKQSLQEENEKLRKELKEANEKLLLSKNNSDNDVKILNNNNDKNIINILRDVYGKIQMIPKEMDKLDDLYFNFISTQTNGIIAIDNKINILKKSLPERSTKIIDQWKKLQTNMEKKQQEIEELKTQREQCKVKIEEMESKSLENQALAQELAELKLHQQQTVNRLEEAETALRDLGPALSSSKLQLIDMKEHVLPNSEWVNDSEVTNCLSCNADFSVIMRKHHCRRCGKIFCDNCSKNRVNLPSHAKPVRVCMSCCSIIESVNSQSIIK